MCAELNENSGLLVVGQLIKVNNFCIRLWFDRNKGSGFLIPAVFQHIFGIPGVDGRAGHAGFILADKKFISAVLSSRILLQELPGKFGTGAAFVTGFNGSGYSNCTFFLYCLFVRNGGANKDFTHFVLPHYRFKGEQIPAIAGI
ncbi:hypothetical protein BvCmsKKP061_04641 [Escherichia coli]|uniref:Uncharacterized protein n=1 Tax=Escherichia coli TaxID=562 RepID=A0A4C9HNY7_ECOLX|nr:hypothetical protein BvCmsKKP061_04641 [Escherichia coli]